MICNGIQRFGSGMKNKVTQVCRFKSCSCRLSGGSRIIIGNGIFWFYVVQGMSICECLISVIIQVLCGQMAMCV